MTYVRTARLDVRRLEGADVPAFSAYRADLGCEVNVSDPREMEIDFTIAPDDQGCGYATEAVDALLDHAFTAMRMHHVVAVTDARNTAAAARSATDLPNPRPAHPQEEPDDHR